MTHETDSMTTAQSRAWVWHSTAQSIHDKQWSVLAVAEIVAAVALYWWLSLRFQWPWFSMVGLIAAPILLLRSEESVNMGVAMLKQWHQSEGNATRRRKGVPVTLATLLATGVVTYQLAGVWFSGQTGWALFWQAVRLGGVALTFMFTFAGLTQIAATGANSVVPRIAIASATATAIGVAAWAGGLVAAVGVAASVVTAMGIVALLWKPGQAFDKGTKAVKVLPLPFVLFAAFSIAVSFLLRSLFIRWIATLRHLHRGLGCLPDNWRETLTVIDLMHPPELVPGAGQVNQKFTARGAWQEMLDEPEFLVKVLFGTMAAAFYLSAVAYRWSLKASAWLWWPLVLALKPPFQGLAGPERREKAAHLTSGAWAFPLALPVVLLLWLLLSTWPSAAAWLTPLPEIAKPAKALLDLFRPSPFSARHLLLGSAALLAIALWGHRKNLYAAWNKPLGSDKDFRDLTPDEQARFLARAATVERLRILLVAVLFLLCETIAVAFAHARNPQGVEQLLWPGVWNWL